MNEFVKGNTNTSFFGDDVIMMTSNDVIACIAFSNLVDLRLPYVRWTSVGKDCKTGCCFFLEIYFSEKKIVFFPFFFFFLGISVLSREMTKLKHLTFDNSDSIDSIGNKKSQSLKIELDDLFHLIWKSIRIRDKEIWKHLSFRFLLWENTDYILF